MTFRITTLSRKGRLVTTFYENLLEALYAKSFLMARAARLSCGCRDIMRWNYDEAKNDYTREGGE